MSKPSNAPNSSSKAAESPSTDAGRDAPAHTLRRLELGRQLGGRTITIAASPEHIRAACTDPQILSRILGEAARVEEEPEGPVWLIGEGEREIRVATERLPLSGAEGWVWRSRPGADLELEIRITLRPAPADRGTELLAELINRPPFGVIGHLIARLRGTDPALIGRQALKRLKMLLETGEIATAAHRRSE